MLKEMLALSDKGARDLKKGIAATAAAHLLADDYDNGVD